MENQMGQQSASAARMPGENEFSGSFATYTLGLAFALLLTVHPSWYRKPICSGPPDAAGLAVLAIAQMGVHLVFFMHISTGPDNTNNVRLPSAY